MCPRSFRQVYVPEDLWGASLIRVFLCRLRNMRDYQRQRERTGAGRQGNILYNIDRKLRAGSLLSLRWPMCKANAPVGLGHSYQCRLTTTGQ